MGNLALYSASYFDGRSDFVHGGNINSTCLWQRRRWVNVPSVAGRVGRPRSWVCYRLLSSAELLCFTTPAFCLSQSMIVIKLKAAKRCTASPCTGAMWQKTRISSADTGSVVRSPECVAKFGNKKTSARGGSQHS